MIVAVDNNWAIGSRNRLLVSIPKDQKHFREETTGKVVVLGRKTLETFPQGQPLQNRLNIILSGDRNYRVKDAVVVHSVEELLEELKVCFGRCLCCGWRERLPSASSVLRYCPCD